MVSLYSKSLPGCSYSQKDMAKANVQTEFLLVDSASFEAISRLQMAEF